ncbi:hypothetical protein D3C81_857880 [compost metagenome]
MVNALVPGLPSLVEHATVVDFLSCLLVLDEVVISDVFALYADPVAAVSGALALSLLPNCLALARGCSASGIGRQVAIVLALR